MKATRKVTPPADLALLRIDRLTVRARRSAELAEHDRENRDSAIGHADQLGFGIRDIWRSTGDEDNRLHISQVDRIILREAAKRQSEAQ